MLNIDNPHKQKKSQRSLGKKLGGLGKGLESLLGEGITTVTKPDENRIWHVAMYKIIPGLNQPRKFFDKSKLKELASSIKKQGVLQPITVKKTGDLFEILAGERRWRASQLAGLKTIPAIVKEVDERASLEMALIENIQRENLNPMEESTAYHHLLSKYKLTQEQIAERVGKDRVTVANMLRLLKLEPQLQKWISQGLLSLGHAKVLLSVKDTHRQKILARQVIEQQLSVRQLEECRAKPKTKKNGRKQSLAEKMTLKIAEDLQKKLGTKVQIDHKKGGKGKMTIYYYSNEQLTALSKHLYLINK